MRLFTAIVVGIWSCVALVAQDPPVFRDAKPENLGPMVNSQYDDILPVISPDGRTLYFCRTNSPENVGAARQDIWVAEQQADGSWGQARNVGQPLNNRDNNYLCSITPDGNLAIVGDGYSDPRNRQRSIAIARRTANGWSTPEAVRIQNFYNNNRFGEYSLANDGRTIIMAVERRDSYGGKDLYVSFKLPDSSWTEPKNLGGVLNTFGHEATPFIASDNTSLYFASDGHGGFGAFDVYVTRRLDSTWQNWSVPQNLGNTINTAGWDLYYTIPAKGDYAYYVSYQNTMGNGDIFRIKLPDSVRPKPVVLVYGKVLNKKTNEPVEADIIYELLPEGVEVGTARSSPGTGDYKIVLPAGSMYGFRASAPKYLSVNDNLDVRNVDTYTEIRRDLYLVPIEKGAVLTLNNIFFDYDRYDLRPESVPELARVAKIIAESPTMVMEIGGHTDSRGSDAYNEKLSDNRANEVARFLRKQSGAGEDRILAKGYGEKVPVATNETDEGRQLNRRVEMKILHE
jgi:outer membrane protein OmpA-like peptidoglycan-associated protein